jgi:death-on-curing protein
MTLFLTTEEIVAGHYFMMKQMNDLDQAGINDISVLESAVNRPMQTVFGEDAYPTLFDKAAALLESLVKNHCFVNGNKRTAYLSMKAFLRVNGYDFNMDRVDAVEFIVSIALGKYQIAEIAEMLEKHSRALK